jgi:hypothetical protein
MANPLAAETASRAVRAVAGRSMSKTRLETAQTRARIGSHLP